MIFDLIKSGTHKSSLACARLALKNAQRHLELCRPVSGYQIQIALNAGLSYLEQIASLNEYYKIASVDFNDWFENNKEPYVHSIFTAKVANKLTKNAVKSTSPEKYFAFQMSAVFFHALSTPYQFPKRQEVFEELHNIALNLEEYDNFIEE